MTGRSCLGRWSQGLVERMFPGAREARRALEISQAGVRHVDELVDDLHRLRRENHFSQALERTIGGR